jgi:hypothetical protein
LLGEDISVPGKDPLVIAGEYGEFEDSRRQRRVDLLALDSAGHVQQIIPLPEAKDFQIQQRQKRRALLSGCFPAVSWSSLSGAGELS